MKTIKIFFASSEELIDDRNAFGNLIRRLNKSYEKRGIHLELFEWEDYDAAYNNRRKQDEYNEEVKASDIFLAVFHTSAGKFTIEEFNVAIEEYAKKKLPKVYTYCKDLQDGQQENEELKAFKNRLLNEMGHYWCRYSHRDTMQLHFVMQLQLVESSSIDNLTIEDGQIFFEGNRIAGLDKLPFVSQNEDYNNMSSRLASLASRIEKARIKMEKYPDDKDFQEELAELMSEHDLLKKDFEDHQNRLIDTARRIVQLQGERITDRMRRAMDALSEGKVREANIILDEAERDGENALKDYISSVELAERKRQNVVRSIEEISLKIVALRADLSVPVEERKDSCDKMFRQVMEMAQAIRYDAVKYLDIVSSYASFLAYYGRFEEEQTQLVKALEICKTVYADGSSLTADLYNRLGISHLNLGDLESAKDYFLLALSLEEEVNHMEHVSNHYNSLASVYHSLGNIDKAMVYVKESLRLTREKYGHYHIYSARGYATLSSMCSDLGYNEEALRFAQEALLIFERYDSESPECAVMYNNIGLIYDVLGKPEEALQNLLTAYEMRRKLFGDSHPDVDNSCSNIASLYHSLGDYENSLCFYKKISDSFAYDKPTIHANLITSYNNVAYKQSLSGEYGQALENYMNALEIYESAGVEDETTLALVYDNIGEVYYKTSEYRKAFDYFNMALEIYRRVYGEEHPLTAKLYNNTGCAYEGQGKYDLALEYNLKALDIRRKLYGDDRDETVLSYNNVAFQYKLLGQYEKALEIMQKVLHIRIKLKGEKHYDTFKSYKNIASIYELLGKSEEALDSYRKALEIIGESDPESKQYEEVFSKVQQYDQ